MSNGIGNLNCPLPHNANVGDDLTYRVQVTDASRVDPFENYFIFNVCAAGSPPAKGAKPGTTQKPPSKEKGKEREKPALLSMPPITPVREPEWPRYEFTKTTALRVKDAGTAESDAGDASTTTYDFYVNVDNQFLKSEQKRSKTSPKMLEARFVYALVLVGLALIQGGRTKSSFSVDEEGEPLDERREPAIEKQIDRVTSALAPILLPMMDLLPELPDGEEGA